MFQDFIFNLSHIQYQIYKFGILKFNMLDVYSVYF